MCFLNYMTKLAIQVYSSFGCNLSRQRDRLEMAINDLGAIQFHAGHLENRTDAVLMEAKVIVGKLCELIKSNPLNLQIVEREDNPQFHSVATFVFHNLLAIMHHYLELGFRMELYVPYEFTYMYWYMGEVEARWMLTTMERSHEIMLLEVKRLEALGEPSKRSKLSIYSTFQSIKPTTLKPKKNFLEKSSSLGSASPPISSAWSINIP